MTVSRYAVKADGKVIDYAYSEKKAWKIANRFADHCYHMDEPQFPKMTVEEETLRDKEEEIIDEINS